MGKNVSQNIHYLCPETIHQYILTQGYCVAYIPHTAKLMGGFFAP